MIQPLLIGTLAFPVFGIIFGYEWWIILLSAVVGGPLTVGIAARNAVFRDVFGRRRSESSDGDSMSQQSESVDYRARRILGTLAIIAGIGSAIAVALILRR
jgi:hypothetical protein